MPPSENNQMENVRMNSSHFFAHMSRMKLISRWPLMRNIRTENVSEHSLQVSMVAHALALIKNIKFGGKLNPERIATMALYHDAGEVLTGDLPTPVKYYNPEITHEYKQIEAYAHKKLLSMLPAELQEAYLPLLDEHKRNIEENAVIKQADALCAYLKCLEEIAAGNKEFSAAKKRLEKTLEERKSPEMDYFIAVFIPGFSLSLDEITQGTPL